MIGTVSGIFVIQRENARKWRLARKTLEGCHISALVFEPRSGLIFAGAHKGSIHASDDLGKTWRHRDDGLTTKDVYCINFVQVQDKTMLYAGTEPARLFQSENLGETWSELQSLRSVASAPKWNFPVPPRIPHVKNIAFDPRNPRIIYACIEQGGLLKSNDGGGVVGGFAGIRRGCAPNPYSYVQPRLVVYRNPCGHLSKSKWGQELGATHYRIQWHRIS